MEPVSEIQKILEAIQNAGQYIIPALRSLLNVVVVIFEGLADLIRGVLGMI